MVTTSVLHGMEAILVQVEADVSPGLPTFEMVGFLGSEVKEAKEAKEQKRIGETKEGKEVKERTQPILTPLKAIFEPKKKSTEDQNNPVQLPATAKKPNKTQ